MADETVRRSDETARVEAALACFRRLGDLHAAYPGGPPVDGEPALRRRFSPGVANPSSGAPRPLLPRAGGRGFCGGRGVFGGRPA